MNIARNVLTSEPVAPPTADSCPQLSMLPEPAALMRVRMRQADLARLFNCSRAAVSTWVKLGWITPELDGLFDPQRVARQLLTGRDSSRMRAKFLAGALDEVNELRRDRDAARREAAEAREALALAQGERERLAARLAAEDAYAERAAGLLFKLGATIREHLPAIERACAPAAAALAAAVHEAEGE